MIWRRLGVALVVLLAPLGAAQTANANDPPTSNPPTNLIAGQVTGADTGAGIAGICVQINDVRGGVFGNSYQTTTDSNGKYEVNVASDNYTVYFTDCRSAATYISQYWDNGAALSMGLTQPARSDINAVLMLRGFIAGTVTDDRTGAPIGGIGVQPNTGGGYGGVGGLGETDQSGSYRFSVDGAPGNYEVSFFTCQGTARVYAPDLYHHAEFLAQATPVPVSSAATTTLNETLIIGGIVTGRVVDALTGLPVAGIDVGIGGYQSTYPYPTIAVTASDGTYAIPALWQGQYTVHFFDLNGRYESQYWNAETSSGSADPVNVRFYDTTRHIDASLQPAV